MIVPSVVGVMVNAASTALSATGRLKLKTSCEYVETSTWPLFKLRSTEVGLAFSKASTPPPAVNATANTTPNAIQPRRAMRRLRLVRLRGGAATAQGSVSCRDVGNDNGARGLSHFAQQCERIEAGRVSALERDLKGVLTDQRYVLDTQLLCIEILHASEAPRDARLATTLSARARPSQLLGRVRAVVSILPRDVHDLTLAIDVDGERKSVRVFQGPTTGR